VVTFPSAVRKISDYDSPSVYQLFYLDGQIDER
jgi:hypothetical protein